MVAKERLALGYLMFRIYSSTHGPEITTQLRAAISGIKSDFK